MPYIKSSDSEAKQSSPKEAQAWNNKAIYDAIRNAGYEIVEFSVGSVSNRIISYGTVLKKACKIAFPIGTVIQNECNTISSANNIVLLPGHEIEFRFDGGLVAIRLELK